MLDEDQSRVGPGMSSRGASSIAPLAGGSLSVGASEQADGGAPVAADFTLWLEPNYPRQGCKLSLALVLQNFSVLLLGKRYGGAE